MVNAVIRVPGSSREVKSPRLDPGGAVVHVDSRTGEALDQLRRQYLGSDRRAGQDIRNISPSGEDAVFQQAGFLPAETVTAVIRVIGIRRRQLQDLFRTPGYNPLSASGMA